MAHDLFDDWRAQHAEAFEALLSRSEAASYGLDAETFARALRRASTALARPGLDGAPLGERLAALHLEDLALAAACLEGSPRAWETLVARHQTTLVQAGRAMHGEAGAEVAEGLVADLFGVDERGRVRRSPLEFFHGRSRLGTWLRTVLAQRVVDRWRRHRREDPVGEDDTRVADESRDGVESRVDRQRVAAAVQRAMDAALSHVTAVDRTRLALYYGQGLSLGQIGRLLREHESTVSRKLARLRADVEQAVRRHLQESEHLAPEAVQAAWELLQAGEGVEVERWLKADRSSEVSR